MKRYTRMSPNSLCMIPRKAIASIMLAMAIMTILSFMLIEVRRILSLRKIPRDTKAEQNLESQIEIITTTINLSSPLEAPKEITLIQNKPVSNLNFTKETWNYDLLEALFEDYPYCSVRPYLLILVASAPDNFERREAIRKSWANPEKWRLSTRGLKSKTVFLVGKSSTKFLNILLENENHMSGDVLIGDYQDTYRNLTRKVMHGFTWALQYCQPTFILKTDDDCFVNVPLILQFLLKFNPVPVNLYAGLVRWSAPVVRNPNSRWYVSNAEYPRPRYAPYASGAGYILSVDVHKKLVLFSDRVPVFPNEDAYVGAVLNAGGVRPTYSGRFVNHPGPWQMCNFLYLFVVHRVKASRQSEFQDMANKAVAMCSMNHIATDWV